MHRESKISVGSIFFCLNFSDIMWKLTTGCTNAKTFFKQCRHPIRPIQVSFKFPPPPPPKKDTQMKIVVYFWGGIRINMVINMVFGRQNHWVKNCGCHEQLLFIVGRPLVIIKVQAAQTHHKKNTKQNKTIFKEEKNLSYLFRNSLIDEKQTLYKIKQVCK